VKGAERYPIASAALDRLLGPEKKSGDAASDLRGNFTLGPSVLRAPPSKVSTPEPIDLEPQSEEPGTDEMLGELVDMVFVGADEEGSSGHPEVHLVFKAEVLGGLHLRLRKMPDGMHATFVVEDSAAKRAVASHIDDLIGHLRSRGFQIANHSIDIAGGP
jgi:hypothetical protein